MRARQPDDEGYVERDGVRIFYEVYGKGELTVLLMPAWTLVHSRLWKAQIHCLARRFRVVCFDPRGNGRSDRPADPAANGVFQTRDDAIAVLDAVGAESVAVVGTSLGSLSGLLTAAQDPRVERVVLMASMIPLGEPWPEWMEADLLAERDSYEGWQRYNLNYWRRDLRGFAEHWFRACLPERHSTRPLESCVEYALDGDPDSLVASLGPIDGRRNAREVFEPMAGLLRSIAAELGSPALVVHGLRDEITPYEWAVELARLTGGELVTLERAGHLPSARWPVEVNLALRSFLEDVQLRAPKTS